MSAEIKSQLKEQIEFYFCDSNFRRDKFLLAETKKDPEGYIPLKVLLTFKRVSNKTTDLSVIYESVKDSDVVSLKLPENASTPLTPEQLDLIQIKKAQPLPEQDDSPNRTLYIKGFPETVSLDDIITFFKNKNSAVLVVRMNRSANKSFKGGCWVELKTPEDAQTLRQQTLNWDDNTPLTILTREEQLAKKESKDGDKKRKEPSFTPNVLVKISETKKATEGEAAASEQKDKPEGEKAEEKAKAEDDKAEESAENEESEKEDKQSSLSKYIKEIVSKAEVKGEFNELEGVFESSSSEDATKLLNSITETPSVSSVTSSTFSAEILTGDAESTYWREKSNPGHQEKRHRGRGRGRGGRGRGGRGRGRGGRGRGGRGRRDD